ncbi:MAG: hypothetical protein VYC34_11250, partial [Planctomycetota bacterium]|nr:hypothetical protein [Planctomycetota bacterium]
DRIVMIARGRVRADGAIRDLVEPLNEAARYVIEARVESGDADIERIFTDTKGVAEVREERPVADDGWLRLSITPWPESGDLRESLAQSARAAGLLVRELRRDTPTLEQLFIRLIDAANEDEDLTERAAT